MPKENDYNIQSYIALLHTPRLVQEYSITLEELYKGNG